ncbi:sorting nexin-14 [Osmia lignaria lignaria]|uniref:sorting nexin-14 n=1 Tax=Osmia lignaria lignaria TaxID=1437193 RepID=UPI0014780798|nr:sorting nexin-14-like [Osmia lignaria]
MVLSSRDRVQDFYVCNVIIPVFVFLLVLFTLIVFKSIIWALVICCLYVINIFYGLVILQYINLVLVNLNAISDTFNPTFEVKDPCSVCSNNSCKRHKQLPHSAKVKIPKDCDRALEQLLEDLLQKYVCAWYSDFSADEAFVQQLRLATATAAKNIAVRLLRTDVVNVVLCRLVPLILQHAQDWKNLNAKINDTSRLGDQIINYFGHEIHPASYSRKAELNYLRGVVTAIIPHLLPAIHVSTNNKVILREILANWILLPAVDAIADPENINALVMLSTHRDGLVSNSMDAVNVPMLQYWVTISSMPKIAQNYLKPSLDEVLNNPQLLYMFMQHIKETGPMNLFQFCLDIDDLSKRMLNPEMSSNAEDSLYLDIQSMYLTYLDPEGPEYLHLPEDISMGIRRILERSSKKIQELRTSRPFYQAHQEAHALLESTCLPSFHHSYQLYDLLCGQPAPNPVKQSRASVSSGTGNSSSKISNHFPKIDGVLRTTTIDGMPFQDIYQGEEIDYSSRAYNEIKGADDTFSRDLTTWRVNIPHMETGDNQALYVIDVHNVAEGKSWTVLRRDQDFYVLRTRLAEFHGDKELSDSPLPSRKNPHGSYTINRQRYEDFLEKLLSKPVLRSSELLYNFLTMPNFKPYLTNCSTPDIGILYQSMANKLRKEKGQNLDKFMNVFLASTNVKNEYMDVGVEPLGEPSVNESKKVKGRDLLFGVFGDNLNFDPNIRDLSSSSSLERSHVKGASFCTVDAVDRLLNVPPIITRILWMFASSSRAKMDPYVNVLLYNTLAKLLSGGRAAIVVKLLHAKVMGDKSSTKDTSRRNYYENAKKGLYGLLPCWLIGFYKPWTELMDSILDSLQNAALNKHLAYVLLDHILINLFPELTV